MSILLKTPFKMDSLETDPFVFGLRPIVIKKAVTELYNDKSILVTGPRGIGKSSLRYQLQNILQGDNTILERCALNVKMGKYITVEYICSSDDTLKYVVESIIDKFEQQLPEFKFKYELHDMSFDFSIFKVFKTKLNLVKTDENNEVSLSDAFVEVIEKMSEMYVEPHINIAIDELDQLNDKYNIAHFIKIVLEKLNSHGTDSLSFILVGQDDLYKRLYTQQQAFSRLVKHIKFRTFKR